MYLVHAINFFFFQHQKTLHLNQKKIVTTLFALYYYLTLLFSFLKSPSITAFFYLRPTKPKNICSIKKNNKIILSGAVLFYLHNILFNKKLLSVNNILYDSSSNSSRSTMVKTLEVMRRV